jgi:hypothetical protein
MSEFTRFSGNAHAANHEASRLCWKWKQGAVLVFEESSHGTAARFLFEDVDTHLAQREMFDLGVEGGLIAGSSLTAFAQGRIEHDAVADLAALLSARPTRTLGTLRLIVPRGPATPAQCAPLRRRAGVPRRPQAWFTETEPRSDTSQIVFSPVEPGDSADDRETDCRYCREGRVPQPLTDRWDRATGRMWHTPWFGYLLPCQACRERGRGPKVLLADEEGRWCDPERPRLTWAPATPGKTHVVFLGKGQIAKMRDVARRQAERRRRSDR